MGLPAGIGQGAVLERSAPPEFCAYCGARLDPLFYFCLKCATPYKSVEAVLPRERPAPLTEGELIEKKAPHVWPIFWTYLAVVVATGIIGAIAFQRERLDLVVLFQLATIFITTCVFAARHWPSLAIQLKRFGFLHPSAWAALGLLPVCLLVNYAYHAWLVRGLGVPDSPLIPGLRKAGVSEEAMVFLICVLPALTEEIAFRGLVQHWLQAAIRPVRAMMLASALFMALHFSVLSAPYLFALGMLLGWAKWKTGSLYPSILIHFLHNLAVLEIF